MNLREKENNKFSAFDIDNILNLLPGNHCMACGYPRCDDFAKALLKKKAGYSLCTYLNQPQHKKNAREIIRLLAEVEVIPEKDKIYGIIDDYETDFLLDSLPNENSCREILYPFDDTARSNLQEMDTIRYRPFGCPIVHFAQVLKVDKGLITVHIKGPLHRLGENFHFIDIGIAIVCGFEGTVIGEVPRIGKTVRFLPHYCMMQKVHSGVVVQAEDNHVLIESIDLKVWAPPISKD